MSCREVGVSLVPAPAEDREQRERFLRAKRTEGSRLQLASQQHVTRVGGYRGIGGRMKSEWVDASNRNGGRSTPEYADHGRNLF